MWTIDISNSKPHFNPFFSYLTSEIYPLEIAPKTIKLQLLNNVFEILDWQKYIVEKDIILQISINKGLLKDEQSNFDNELYELLC